jgi:hypothetical protein
MQSRIATGAVETLASFRRCDLPGRRADAAAGLDAFFVERPVSVVGGDGRSGAVRFVAADRAADADGDRSHDLGHHRSPRGRSAPPSGGRQGSARTVGEAASASSGTRGPVVARRRSEFSPRASGTMGATGAAWNALGAAVRTARVQTTRATAREERGGRALRTRRARGVRGGKAAASGAGGVASSESMARRSSSASSAARPSSSAWIS